GCGGHCRGGRREGRRRGGRDGGFLRIVAFVGVPRGYHDGYGGDDQDDYQGGNARDDRPRGTAAPRRGLAPRRRAGDRLRGSGWGSLRWAGLRARWRTARRWTAPAAAGRV